MSEGKAPGVGDPAPDFTLKTIGLRDVSLKSLRGKNVVLLFYPLDWTPGCSTCMPAFDRRIKEFEAAQTQVLGISTDSPFSHEAWAKSVGISNYPLLSDIHRTTSRAYGVYWPDWNANVRATFVIDKQGTIQVVERYGKSELPNPDKILAEVKKLP